MEPEDPVARLTRGVGVARTELNKLRCQVRGLRLAHQKDVAGIKRQLDQVQVQPGASSGLDETLEHQGLDLRPIGWVKSCFQSKNGTPRQSGLSPTARGTLHLGGPEVNGGIHNLHYALEGLSAYSHIWLIFLFHENNGPRQFLKTKVRPPRLKERVGLFATRSPHRPNPVGLTLAKIEAVREREVDISGIDLIDGTPILDLKPYIPDYDQPVTSSSSSDAQVSVPNWVNDPRDDLSVIFSPSAMSQVASLDPEHDLHSLNNPGEVRQAIAEVLRADPRSVYRKEQCSDQLYFVTVDGSLHVTAWFDDERLEVTVLKVRPLSQLTEH